MKPGIIGRVRTSVAREADSCTVMYRNHTEHLLQNATRIYVDSFWTLVY
jgi:hypothetical protein